MSKRKIRFIMTIGIIVTFCMILIACAPGIRPETPEDDEYEFSNAAYNWSTESNCPVCHDRADSSLAALKCEAAHKAGAGNNCMSCHTNTSELKTAHAKVTYADTNKEIVRLDNSMVQQSTCLACHKLEDLIIKTATTTVLTDNAGTTVNPHEVTLGDYNLNGKHDAIICADCHKFHWEKTLGEIAYSFCRSCHHEGDYVCGGCH